MKTKLLVVALACALFLHGCGSTKMSLEEVENAISDGILTVEDAKEQGLVDEEWVAQYNAKQMDMSVPAVSKLEANNINHFTTTTIEGDAFESDTLNSITYYAFINPSSDEGKQAFEVLQENYDSIITGGGDVLIINTSNEAEEYLLDSKFTVINYNESMIEALGDLNEMVNVESFTGCWNANGSFISAWSLKIESTSFIETMHAIIDMVNF